MPSSRWSRSSRQAPINATSRRPAPSLARAAAVCGVVAFFTSTAGWLLGGLAQPDAYSAANDDISDLGALTAHDAWLYNQLGANLGGALTVFVAVVLWLALSPSLLGRLGAAALAVGGTGVFLDGLFRLDCRGIDAGCHNDSWHAHAHKIESGITAVALLLAPLVLAAAFRRIPTWRGAWLPSLLTVPLVLLANVVFSTMGDGAATRAGTVVISAWVAFVAVWCLRAAEAEAAPAS
jgi:hypothetical protein